MNDKILNRLKKEQEEKKKKNGKIITKGKFIDLLLKKSEDWHYDKEKDILSYKGMQVDIDVFYEGFLLENGMSFKCICDMHWECMSILECNKCGTVIKYSYDEWDYESNFRCPICTDYKTGFEYHTKEEIANSDDLQAIIEMYKDLDKIQEEQYERSKKRNGLSDWELCKPKCINIKEHAYQFQLLINSILNKNKLSGLRLQITKYEKDDSGLVSKWYKNIPLSIGAVRIHHRIQQIRENPELDPFNDLKGKSLSEHMEEAVVKVRKREKI